MKTQRRFASCPGTAPHIYYMGASDLLCSYLYLSWNLDVDSSGVPFLVSALSIFLIANISMISSFPFIHPTKKASKKTAHSIWHLVGRKAMQNYSRTVVRTKLFRKYFSSLTSFK